MCAFSPAPFDSGEAYELEGSLWLHTPELDWSPLTQGLTPRTYLPREELFHQSQDLRSVYLCQSGRIQLDVCDMDGGRRILFICGGNTLFGELSLFDTRPSSCTAVSVTRSSVYLISASGFLAALEQYPQLSANVMKTQSKKLRLLTTIVKQLSFHDAAYRVAYALVNLVNDYSRRSDGQSYKLTLKYTHQDLADLTGLSRVCVSGIMKRFEHMGILARDPSDGHTVITEPAKLYSLLTDLNEPQERL